MDLTYYATFFHAAMIKHRDRRKLEEKVLIWAGSSRRARAVMEEKCGSRKSTWWPGKEAESSEPQQQEADRAH